MDLSLLTKNQGQQEYSSLPHATAVWIRSGTLWQVDCIPHLYQTGSSQKGFLWGVVRKIKVFPPKICLGCTFFELVLPVLFMVYVFFQILDFVSKQSNDLKIKFLLCCWYLLFLISLPYKVFILPVFLLVTSIFSISL